MGGRVEVGISIASHKTDIQAPHLTGDVKSVEKHKSRAMVKVIGPEEGLKIFFVCAR